LTPDTPGRGPHLMIARTVRRAGDGQLVWSDFMGSPNTPK
jgi:hypothetical protein